MTRGGRARTLLLLVLAGCFLVQVAWSLALPPFRGTDEFDHAFRAAEVAHGEWLPRDASIVTVPEALVDAAHPLCESYTYTVEENCSAMKHLPGGMVEIRSRAANYNPIFYFVVGSAGLPFDGFASLYAMRTASALLCLLFVGLAWWTTRLWARTRWPLAALFAAATPVMLFSLSILAPNGLEMAAATALWSALLGLTSERGRERHATALLLVATGSAMVVATLRTLGPLWIGLAGLAVLALMGWRAFAGLVRRRGLLMGGCAALVVATAASAGAWTRSAGTSTLTPYSLPDVHPLPDTLEQVPLWFLQGIAAFPRRSDPAPLLVYVLVGLTVLTLLVVGVRRGSASLRVVLLGCLAVAVLLPAVFTYTTIAYASPIWQGRYGLPFHLGVVLLAGLALERRPLPDRVATPAILVGGLALAAANALAIVHVLDKERRTSPYRSSPDWLSAPPLVVGATVVVAFALLTWAVVRAREVADAPSADRADPVAESV